jgi:hypothetical protein
MWAPPHARSRFSSSPGAALPLLRFSVRDSISKRLRSFGDLQNVPDVDNSRRASRARNRPSPTDACLGHARARTRLPRQPAQPCARTRRRRLTRTRAWVRPCCAQLAQLERGQQLR